LFSRKGDGFLMTVLFTYDVQPRKSEAGRLDGFLDIGRGFFNVRRFTGFFDVPK
jgi:hypothetical protein